MERAAELSCRMHLAVVRSWTYSKYTGKGVFVFVVVSFSVTGVLEMEPGALLVFGTCSTTELHPCSTLGRDLGRRVTFHNSVLLVAGQRTGGGVRVKLGGQLRICSGG